MNGVAALAPNDVWAVGFSTHEPPLAESATLTLIEQFGPALVKLSTSSAGGSCSDPAIHTLPGEGTKPANRTLFK